METSDMGFNKKNIITEYNHQTGLGLKLKINLYDNNIDAITK